MNFNKAKAAYFGVTAVYGGFRKLVLTSGARVEHYNHVEKRFVEEDMLWSSKLGLSAVGAATSVAGAWPLYLANDLWWAELRLRGKRPEDYGYVAPKSDLYYLFS